VVLPEPESFLLTRSDGMFDISGVEHRVHSLPHARGHRAFLLKGYPVRVYALAAGRHHGVSFKRSQGVPGAKGGRQ